MVMSKVAGSVVVNVRQIPAEGLSLSDTVIFPAVYDLPTAGPIHYRIHLTPQAGDAVYAAGHVTGALRLECVRCLQPFSFEAGGPIHAYFTPAAPTSPTSNANRATPADETDVYPVTDNSIVLDDAMMGGLYVSTPTYPLCDEACAGLCAQCGAALKHGPCGAHGVLETAPVTAILSPTNLLNRRTPCRIQNTKYPSPDATADGRTSS